MATKDKKYTLITATIDKQVAKDAKKKAVELHGKRKFSHHVETVLKQHGT